ncbi:Petal formation-expressed [Dillenia turbinata]|uniref:Petal formation-expressed n=1 Tax=Dillenia turbinata TaxID=194707 RepID=A0AAN8WIY6_9MAGN
MVEQESGREGGGGEEYVMMELGSGREEFSRGSGRESGGGEEYVMMELGSGREEHSRGLGVPVIRNADRMNFADIEKEINTLAKKANDGSISIDEMAGSTFTISNGGVYGSLLSIPIINPPQSAILALASVVNSIEHGGQVGMVFEIYRSSAGFFQEMEESIEENLEEKGENGELFEVKVALQLGRSIPELRELAGNCLGSLGNDESRSEFASKLF